MPQWINSVRWSESTVLVDLARQAVKDSPPYAHTAPLQRRRQAGLYEHYGWPNCWTDALKRDNEISRI